MEVTGQIQAMALLPKIVSHFPLFSITLMNEEIMDIMIGWTTLISAKK
jgi:hypothetical protein